MQATAKKTPPVAPPKPKPGSKAGAKAGAKPAQAAPGAGDAADPVLAAANANKLAAEQEVLMLQAQMAAMKAKLEVRVVSRSISPPWGSIRFRLAPRTYAPWGCIVRVVPDRHTKSRQMPTRNT